MGEIAIDIKNLNKTFSVEKKGNSLIQKLARIFIPNYKKVYALKNINIKIKKGESVGIIGRNGSGKSTLLKLIIGAYAPDKGSIINTEGKIIRLSLDIGLDQNLTARDNIYLNGTILGLNFRQIGIVFNEIIGFAELENFIDTPIKYYSSGMKSRLSFAIALHAEADIFLIDEFFGDVGDEIFKEKTQRAFEENVLKGKTIIHVSHSLDTLKSNCDRMIIISKGEAIQFTDLDEAVRVYRSEKM